MGLYLIRLKWSCLIRNCISPALGIWAIENNNRCRITPHLRPAKITVMAKLYPGPVIGLFFPSAVFRWGNQQREVYLNLLITGKWVAAQPISVTLAGFSRIWADEEAQPLGSRWHFHVYHQNAKLVNEFLTLSSMAGTVRAEREQKKTRIKGTERDQELLIPVLKHSKARTRMQQGGRYCQGQTWQLLIPNTIHFITHSLRQWVPSWGKWLSQMGDNGSFLELCKE